jgi:hypothetical protein
MSYLQFEPLPPGSSVAFPAQCDNRTDAPAINRCWPVTIIYPIMITEGFTYDATGARVGTNYNNFGYNSTVICLREAPSDCVEEYGAFGCLKLKFREANHTNNVTEYISIGAAMPDSPASAQLPIPFYTTPQYRRDSQVG